jgi:cytochrome c oxidase cbb3-type subunit 3
MNPDANKPANKSVKDGPVLREHVFDGIEEFDQKLPNWWLFTFYIAIAFYVGYWVIYYSSDALKSPAEVINSQMAAINDAKQKELSAMLDKLDDEVLVEWSKNDAIVAQGQELFNITCIACHGADLNGGIGRSLMDDHWQYGAKPMDIFNIILKGSPADSEGYKQAKMIPYENSLGAEKVAQVTAFILSKNPPKK